MTGYIIASSLLIGAVILLRALVRRAVSPRLVYALWLVVLLRLCIPVQPFTLTLPQRENQRPPLEHLLPETQTPLPENIPGTQESTSAPQREPFVPDEIAPPQNIPETTPPETSHVLTPTEPAQNKINFTLPDTKTLLVRIWVIGSAAVGIWFASAMAVHILKLRRNRRFLFTRGKTRVYLSPNAKGPYVAGIFPSVYLDPQSTESSDLELILAHEKAHIRQGDQIWNIVRTLGVTVFWWNPLVWAAAKLSALDAELACDSAVCKNLDEDGRIYYAKMLVRLAPHKPSPSPGLGSGSLKARIKMLINQPKKRILTAVAAVLLAVLVGGCSLSGIETATSASEETNLETPETTTVTTETTASFTETTSATLQTDPPPATEETTETLTEEDTEPAAPANVLSIAGKDYWYIAKYNTTVEAKYDEDNFLGRFSSAYNDVEVVPGATVVGSDIAYDDGTLVYITARDGSWTYGPATVKTHHTAPSGSALHLYFGSEEERQSFEAVNLSGCTVYEILEKYETPEPTEIDGSTYYTVGTRLGSLSLSIDESIPDYTLIVDEGFIPQGSIVYLESQSYEGLTFGPITGIKFQEKPGNSTNIQLVLNNLDSFYQARDTISQYNLFKVRVLSTEPDAELLPPAEQTVIPYYDYEYAAIPEENMENPGSTLEIHVPVTEEEAVQRYEYGHPSISDVTFTYNSGRENVINLLYGYFSPSALTPLAERDSSFEPTCYLDFNNGWVVGVSADRTYCEAVRFYVAYDGESSYNHLYDENFAQAIKERGIAYEVSQSGLDSLNELISAAEIGYSDPTPPEEYTLPTQTVPTVELDEMWKNVRSAKICYPMYQGETVEADYPIPYENFVPYVTFTVDDPEVLASLICCLHPDNLKPNASLYRSPPDTYLCFDNGYYVGLYFGTFDYDISFSVRANGVGCAMTPEATEYMTELFRAIETPY